MANKKLRPIARTDEDQLFDALLGPDEDIDPESARQIIEAHGIKSSDLVSNFKSKLEEEARKLRLQGTPVPPLMQNALQNLKTGLTERPDPIAANPTAWLDGLLSGTLQPTQHQAAYSLRQRKGGEQLSSKDQKILDILNDEIEGEDRTN
jgi:hypothetical protein